jgi:hypothetical protein
MDARQIAGRFAAYVWYMEIRVPRTGKREAARFARTNWQAFVPIVNEGLGLLIERIAAKPHRESGAIPRKRLRKCIRARAGAVTKQLAN